jgi:hypothetical protein
MVRKLWRFARLCLVPAVFCVTTSCVVAQTATTGTSSSSAQTVEDALHQMSDMAGIVFVGQIVAVRWPDSDDGISGVVEVEFLIAQAVRGCAAGSTYVLREWAGLWSGGDQRYRVGQRLLMFLHEPGPGGVTSPVGGMAGAIPIRGAGNAPRSTDASTSPQLPVADLRWVGTKLLRPVVYRADSTHSTAPTRRSFEAVSADPSDASVAAQQASVDVVLGMLNTWQKAQHASR